MVDQLESVEPREVMHLLEPTWQRTDVFEPLLLHVLDGEPQHILVELLYRDTPVLHLLTQLVVALTSIIRVRRMAAVESKQAYMVGVLIVL